MASTGLRRREWLASMQLAALPRMRQVRSLRERGLTLAEIGDRLGVSRQRVHQMLAALDRAEAKE